MMMVHFLLLVEFILFLRISLSFANIDNGKAEFSRPAPVAKFRAMGQSAGTDKVSTHHYEYIYGKYFAHDTLRLGGHPMRLLEIGLGCNMVYGAGKSVILWKSWFKHLDLHTMEYDAACVEKWKDDIASLKNVTVHVGSQSKVEDLRALLTRAQVSQGSQPWLPGQNQFDAIIDDGGHYFDQITTSFDILFQQALKPGGVYIIEDIGPIRKPYPGRAYLDGQMINWIQGMSATLMGNAGQEAVGIYEKDPMNMHARQARWVAAVEVQKNSVAIIKATEEECRLQQAWCPEVELPLSNLL